MVKLSTIVINSSKPDTLAAFWAAFLETEIAFSDSGFTWLKSDVGQPRLAVQHVKDPTEGRRRLHLDFAADDVAGEVQRALALGAVKVEEHSISDFHWIVLADPTATNSASPRPRASRGGRPFNAQSRQSVAKQEKRSWPRPRKRPQPR